MAKGIPKRSKHAPAPAAHEETFPVVGVGASAGGLEAFTALLKHLPPDSGMAFVLIQHLDWRRESQLAELLSRATPMPVTEVKTDTPLEPDHVYIIAPSVDLGLSGSLLKAEARAAGHNLPIDRFFESLARAKGANAVGVVLSGTASDGTLGLKAIRGEGGITFAQDPSTAKFDGMPRSAIAAGVVDFILSPEDIGQGLVRLARHPYVARQPEQNGEPAAEAQPDLTRVFEMLRAATGLDFGRYKGNTIRRRIHRRMLLHAAEKLRDYVAYLEENPAEVRALADDLLIRVTSFFREPAAFEALTDKVFPEILQNRSPQDTIRIWVPGCATGEEAYSIAICLTEFLERSGTNARFQIFATDVSEAAIEKARAGTYATAALEGLSAERLKRFFVKSNGGCQIHKSIRETCIFATQNIGKDPPFHKLDLISCCNVLIYFGPVLQRKTLSIFHYALKPSGFLMLGQSEGVGTLAGAFVLADKKLKLYSKGLAEPPASILRAGESAADRSAGADIPGAAFRPALDVQKTAERMLLEQYAPAGVIVDDAMNVVHVRGDTSRYLQLADGEPTYHLLKMAREGLVVALRMALAEAKKKKTTIAQQARVRNNGQSSDVNLRVVPINATARQDPVYFMVLFEEAAPAAGPAPASGGEAPLAAGGKSVKAAGPRGIRENARLKRELARTKDYLQSIVEEQEASSEELKSANEEAQAVNEELETAKEELQSANEELNTVNDELKARNTALTDLNSDLQNVLTGIDVPLVMVGRDLAIRRFTQSMEPMLNLIDSDVGRPIANLKPNIDLPDLPSLLRGAVAGETPVPREVQGPNGRWYSLRVLPYRTPDGRINGALLVLLDIDAIRHGRDFAESVIETVRQPLLILDPDLRVRGANEAFYQTFHASKTDTENRFLHHVGNGQWNIPRLREALGGIVPGAGFEGLVVEHRFEALGQKTLALSGREIVQPEPYGRTILLAIDDITARRRAEETEAELARAARALTVGELTASIAHEVNQPLTGVVTNAETGLRWLDNNPPNLPEARDSLALIVRDGNRASAIIRRIRDFLRKETGPKEPLDINAAIEEAADLARAGLLKDRIALRFKLSTELPPVRADRIQLQQVILNLMMNAREAMASKDGSRDLLVTSERSPEGVLVAVRDSGVGVDKSGMNRMFDAFFTSKPMGMGMGLSISRSIVEAHGGRIGAAPNDGEGLTVWFSLPTGI